ncbi:MAG: pyruvate formate-lyase-activating protein [Bifidobacterium tibiigranuli]|uniref:pyruvate formate-lyase-activating protein n=1 Tax=Bifidobacterium tibiigranuli TaxID=2172043 RepID=UPI0026F1EE5D|nr:pyruvate formate-lyase-activating protein [Bifidobacterium tibiigranuli]MCI1673931.1 pyruvate formate-lyase-activating protein [Bifidobacterium tibiigranuli]MCI1712180.1 pyruvate formate-lyase-activating protein [Bifidobacterium tibiigranuli]MCI1834896.1 pyruvate formate-lyase-activating protein [Bifidobacterium tibiigranuli]
MSDTATFHEAFHTAFHTTKPHMLKGSREYARQTLMGGLSGFESPIGLDRHDRIAALKTGDIGFVHSWDINTSVDGPGTRMTVFMSGCPLRCQFCQNPDTWKMRDGQPVYLDAMINKVARYADLFKATGGGITFSGGESMMQPAFVSRVFRAAKEMGVHTCLDTAGFLNKNYTDEMIDDIDLCLLDVKAGDEERYKVLTGGTLAPTIKFGQRLAARGKKIWVRFVLIPGLTDPEDNIENIANIVETFGDAVEHIDVLPFHQLGRPKWHELRIPYPLENQKGPSAALKDRVVKQFEGHGFTVY